IAGSGVLLIPRPSRRPNAPSSKSRPRSIPEPSGTACTSCDLRSQATAADPNRAIRRSRARTCEAPFRREGDRPHTGLPMRLEPRAKPDLAGPQVRVVGVEGAADKAREVGSEANDAGRADSRRAIGEAKPTADGELLAGLKPDRRRE